MIGMDHYSCFFSRLIFLEFKKKMSQEKLERKYIVPYESCPQLNSYRDTLKHQLEMVAVVSVNNKEFKTKYQLLYFLHLLYVLCSHQIGG